MGADDCVEEEFYNYPCKNGTECFIAAKEKPTKQDIEGICKTAKPCKEKRKCFKGDISSPAILKCAENLRFCKYNNPDGSSFMGADNCVEEEFYNYPCKNGTVCFIDAAEAPPTKQDIEGNCETAKPCKEKKKCFKGDISSTAILKCKADAAICKYTADGSGSFTGENDCVAKDSYNYPCKNETVCFITAKEKPPTVQDIKDTCKKAKPCKDSEEKSKDDDNDNDNGSAAVGKLHTLTFIIGLVLTHVMAIFLART